jgi:hypothetical protein
MPRGPNANDREAAARFVAENEQAQGPHVLADQAEELHAAIVPAHAEDLDLLAGRIALTMEEIQLALGLGEKAVRAAMRDGSLPSVLIGGRRMFPVKAIERHLEALSYAEAGVLDAWQAAVLKGSAQRISRARRLANARRKAIRRKMSEAHRAMTPEEALGLQADLAELERQQALGERTKRDMQSTIDGVLGQ